VGKEASILDGSSFPGTPMLTFYKLREIERLRYIERAVFASSGVSFSWLQPSPSQGEPEEVVPALLPVIGARTPAAQELRAMGPALQGTPRCSTAAPAAELWGAETTHPEALLSHAVTSHDHACV